MRVTAREEKHTREREVRLYFLHPSLFPSTMCQHVAVFYLVASFFLLASRLNVVTRAISAEISCPE